MVFRERRFTYVERRLPLSLTLSPAYRGEGIIAAFVIPGIFLAHAGGKPHDLQEAVRTWGWEPYVWLGLAVSAWLYVAGLRRMWRDERGAGVATWEAWCFAG